MTDDLQKLLDAATKGPWRVGNSLYPSQCIMAGDTLIATHINSVNSPLMALAPTLAARVIAADKVVAAARELCQRVEQQQNGWPMRADYVPNALLPAQEALAAYDSLTTPSAPAPQST